MKYKDALYEHSTKGIPVPFLYHATREVNLPSIYQHGLLTKFYGTIHGSIDIHPPKPSLYLSRKSHSDNLHAALFEMPVVILKIDTKFLDPDEMWPDDFIYFRWAENELLETSEEIAKALGINHQEAEELSESLKNTSDKNLPLAFKPFWRWYLMWHFGGEVAYTANISARAIVDVRRF